MSPLDGGGVFRERSGASLETALLSVNPSCHQLPSTDHTWNVGPSVGTSALPVDVGGRREARDVQRRAGRPAGHHHQPLVGGLAQYATASASTCAQRIPPWRSAGWARRSRSSTGTRKVGRSQPPAACHGIGARRPRPSPPVRPTSSPANIIGAPGRSRAARRPPPPGPGRPRRCGSGRCRASRAASTSASRPPRHPARRSRIVAHDGVAAAVAARRRGRRGSPAALELRRAQPGPQRPGEAGVVHRALPAAAVEVGAGVVGVLGDAASRPGAPPDGAARPAGPPRG